MREKAVVGPPKIGAVLLLVLLVVEERLDRVALRGRLSDEREREREREREPGATQVLRYILKSWVRMPAEL